MKHDNNIDDIFREKLGAGGSFSIPNSFIIDIERRLDELEEKKKKPGFWIWLLPVFTTLLVTVYSIEIFTQSNEEAVFPIESIKYKRNPFVQRQLEDIETISQHTAIKQTSSSILPSPEVAQHNQSPVKNTGTQSIPVRKQEVENNTATPPYFAPAFLPEKEEAGVLVDEINITTLLSTASEELIEDDFSGIINSTDSTQQLASDSSFQNIFTELEGPGFFVGLNSGFINIVKKSIYNEKPNFFIDLTAGAHYVWKNFEYASEAYNIKRETEEENILAIDAELLFGIRYKKFTLQTGIAYSEWGEKINYSPLLESEWSYDSWYDSTLNDTVTIATENMEPNEAVTWQNGRNRYRYINIPLLLGYEWRKEKITLAAKLGGVIGLSLDPAHKSYMNDMALASVNSPTPNAGLKRPNGYYISRNMEELVIDGPQRFLFNIYIGLDAKYRLGNFDLLLSTSYKRNVYHYLVNSWHTRNSYRSLGLRAGVSYNF